MDMQKFVDNSSTKKVFHAMVSNKAIRKPLLEVVKRRTYRGLVENNPDNRPESVQKAKYNYLLGLLNSFDKSMEKGIISQRVTNRLMDVFLQNVVLDRIKQEEDAVSKLGFKPPLFVLISPTGTCNLKCTGCYAASDPSVQKHLSYEVFNRILDEKREMWNSYFTAISGGEPFLWKDKETGKGLLDVIEEHSSELFMVYTNATLITEDVAKRMGEMGNITPVVSVEGFRKETEERRGKGVFDKILRAFELFRENGIPFGISTTPTKHNWDIITSDEFVDFYFEEQGAFYGWMFQYMPVGRGWSLDMMPEPEERMEMLRRTRRIVEERQLFFADFWNSGIASNGCISAGRSGGYFFIDWNGDAMPCVFIPFAGDNMYDVYERGENINAVLRQPLFTRIRSWQNQHGFAKPPEDVKNWLCPCPFRDHFGFLRNAVQETCPRPVNQDAEDSIHDEEFYRGMAEYGRQMHEMTQQVWEENYAEKSDEEKMKEEEKKENYFQKSWKSIMGK